MSLGSIIVGPVEALTLTTVLDAFGGLTLLRLDTRKDTRKLWLLACSVFHLCFLGLLTGNRAFIKTSETWYSRAAGAISVIAAVRILLRVL